MGSIGPVERLMPWFSPQPNRTVKYSIVLVKSLAEKGLSDFSGL
jgi:hypothetical protein